MAAIYFCDINALFIWILTSSLVENKPQLHIILIMNFKYMAAIVCILCTIIHEKMYSCHMVIAQCSYRRICSYCVEYLMKLYNFSNETRSNCKGQ